MTFESSTAKLVSTVMYTRLDGSEAVLSKGTKILVDLERGIATTLDLDNPDHFDISPEEYQLDRILH